MIRISAVFAIFAALAAVALAPPYSSQAEASQEVAALPKGDKLQIAVCLNQTWPNLSGVCLRGAMAKTAIRNVTSAKS